MNWDDLIAGRRKYKDPGKLVYCMIACFMHNLHNITEIYNHWGKYE